MRVALDLSPLDEGLPPGVARVFHGALAALRARGDVELVPLTPPPAHARGLRRALWRQHTLAREAARAGAELVHCFVSAFPLRAPVPVVATVHELPWRRGERENAGIVHRAFARLALRRCAAVVTPSRAVAAALAELGRGRGPAAGVHVIPWGLAATFAARDAASLAEPSSLLVVPPSRTDGSPLESAEIAGGGPRPFVLLVGGARAKKRLDLLVAAQRLASVDWDIVVTGRSTEPGEALGAGAGRGVRHVGVVDDGALATLYRAAAATAVLARSEGFAFPVLESFAAGTAVVAPHGSVQAETAGGLAHEFDAEGPGAARALATALDTLVRAKVEHTSEAGERDTTSDTTGPGRARETDDAARRRAWASTFRFERTAAELVALWRRVLEARAEREA